LTKSAVKEPSDNNPFIKIFIAPSPAAFIGGLQFKDYGGGGEAVTIFIVPDFGDIADYGKGFSNGPTRPHRLTGWYDNPMPTLTISPQSGIKNLASGHTGYESGGEGEEPGAN
jgi:hypothetical protein